MRKASDRFDRQGQDRERNSEKPFSSEFLVHIVTVSKKIAKFGLKGNLHFVGMYQRMCMRWKEDLGKDPKSNIYICN